MMAAEKFSLQEAQELKSKILRLPESEYMPKDPSVIQAVKAKLDSMIQTTKSDFQKYGELKQFCQVDSRKVDAGKYEIKPESDKRTNAEIMAEYLSYNLTKYAHAKTPRQKDMNKSNVKILNYSSDLDENLKHVLVIRDKANGISTAEAVPDPVQPSEAVQSANRQERISKPTSASDVLPKQKQQIKKKVETPTVTRSVTEISPSVSVNENASGTTSDDVTPVVGTPFLSHGFKFVLYKPSEAYQKPARKAIIDRYLYEDTVSFFFGPSSSYKTFWLIWEAAHIATGKELCGMTINGGARKILFVSLEMTAKDISDRLHNMTANWTAKEQQLLDENFYIISSEDEAKIRATSKNILEALMDACNKTNAGGIYLDAYTEYIVGLDVRSESQQGDVINAMRMKANKHHVYFRVIHHSTKTVKTKDGDIDGSMAGIHTIRDTADQVYALKITSDKNAPDPEIRITNDQNVDSSAKPRFSKALTFTVKFVSDEERGSFTFIRLQDNETSSYMDKFKQLLEIVEEDPGINSSDLKVKFGDNKLCRDVISNAIKNHTIIMVQEKSQRGSPTKKHYPPEYYNEHEVEILRRKA